MRQFNLLSLEHGDLKIIVMLESWLTSTWDTLLTTTEPIFDPGFMSRFLVEWVNGLTLPD